MNLNSILIAQTEAENKAKINEISTKYKISSKDKNELMNMMDEAYKSWNREQTDNHRFSNFLKGILGTDYNKMCEKPTPLGVGWIAQKYKLVYVYIDNIHIV